MQIFKVLKLSAIFSGINLAFKLVIIWVWSMVNSQWSIAKIAFIQKVAIWVGGLLFILKVLANKLALLTVVNFKMQLEVAHIYKRS